MDSILRISFFCYPDGLLTPSLHSYAHCSLNPSLQSVGINLPTKQISVDQFNFKLFLADISTKEHFAQLFLSHIRETSAAVFAYSKNSRKFLDSAIALYHLFRQHIPHPTLPIAFIGLHDESEGITQAEGQSLAQELGADYFEMAVDDLQTLDTVLKSLSRKLIALKPATRINGEGVTNYRIR